MLAFIAEIFFELVIELVGGAVGFGVAFVAYRIWIAGRQGAWWATKPTIAETPEGDRFTIEIVGLRPQLPVSSRALGRSIERPTASNTDRLHPDRLLDNVDGCLVVIAPVVLVGVVAVLVLAIVELVVVGVILGIVAALRLLLRQDWMCVVTDAEGRQYRHRCDGLRAARELRSELAAEIALGRVTRAVSEG